MESSTIQNALKMLYSCVDKSSLPLNEKNGLKRLIKTLDVYYVNKYDSIENSLDYDTIRHRLNLLTSQMTDYIVAINDTLKGKNNAFYIINMIYKEINYDEKKGIFKRRRLI